MIRWFTKKVKGKSELPIRERLSLSQLLTWTVVTAIIGASMTAGYYALNVLYENKLVDTWAIMFLELEHEGSILNKRLLTLSRGLDKSASDDDVTLLYDEKGQVTPLTGSISGVNRLEQFQINPLKDLIELHQITILSALGSNYLALIDLNQKRLTLRRLASKHFMLNPARPANQGSLYLITRQARLLYSNNPELTEINLTDRPLVQKFIKAPIKQGQLDFIDVNGEELYGFFAEIPESNLILFSEVTKAAAMAPIRQIITRFFGVLIGIVIAVIILLQLPLSRITAPVKELALMARQVGDGKFDVRPKQEAFGELSVLSKAFGSMAKGLLDRDRRVAALMLEQTEKMRLAGEMAIARRIQENLLPSSTLPTEAGISLASVYISANECAGDWYQYYYDPKNKETIFVIADVSGHGAGSSVFTAVIAGLFDQSRHRSDEHFPIEEFVYACNAAIYRLGKQQWHATMFIARYSAGNGSLDYINAGHPAPFVKRKGGVESLMGSSDSVLGLSLESKFPRHQAVFEHQDTVLLYTDGLIEAARPDGKMFGRKKARDLLKHAGNSPGTALTQAMDSWKLYLDGASPEDDVCVLIVRAA